MRKIQFGPRALPLLFAGALLAPLSADAQQQGEPQGRHMAKRDQRVKAESDQAFMTEAAMGNLAETQLAQLALDHTEHEKVKSLAQMILTDHRKAEQAVKSYLERQELREPQRVTREATRDFTKLSQSPREDLDKNYLDVVVKNHQKYVKTYETWQTRAQDAEVKSYINQTLPDLRKHLQSAQQLQKELRSTQTS